MVFVEGGKVGCEKKLRVGWLCMIRVRKRWVREERSENCEVRGSRVFLGRTSKKSNSSKVPTSALLVLPNPIARLLLVVRPTYFAAMLTTGEDR